ncbi:cellulose synthase [Aureimonas mangrovi]|uniref:cellulose synthase n=1 Tax=Aureimonas mangrovi TaxID=2758041 RepID=UPI00163D8327|nr:cellulose synthase [Aureimonas mangrovi]
MRYFAQQGDTRRLQTEIARLQALYPDWTPPENPLAVPQAGDPELDLMWSTYARGEFAQVRELIAARQERDPDWTVPTDLLERLGVAEARLRLVNASNLQQYETVIRVAARTPSLLTCSEVDILWRLARAFAETERPERAQDAYGYVLSNCDDEGERLATIQMAQRDLDRGRLDQLLALERTNADGTGEFASLRFDLAKEALAAAGAEETGASVSVSPQDLDRVREAAEAEGAASDAQLLGWYYLRRNQPQDAETWFRRAQLVEPSSSSAQGLALALIALSEPAQAEAVARPYAQDTEGGQAVYVAASANLLAVDPPVFVDPATLGAMASAVAAQRDANAAQQFGWYSYSLNQFETAAQWFQTSLAWDPSVEPAAFGLALTRQRLGQTDAVSAIQVQWAGRSPRIAAVGRPGSVPVDGRPPLAAPAPNAYAVSAPTSAPTPPLGTASAAATTQAPSTTTTLVQAPLAYSPALSPASPMVAPAAPPAAAPQAPVQVVRQIPMSNGTAAASQPALQPAAQPAPAQTPPPMTVVTIRPTRPAADPAPARAAPAQTAGSTAGCRSSVDPRTFSPEGALDRGWCLMQIDRPLEAAPAFEVALLSRSAQTRQDAAYGQSLAYLRAGLSDRAAVSASKAPQSRDRQLELETAILTDQATSAWESNRPRETLLALEQRSAIAADRLDLMVLQGYAYLELRRYADAEKVFSALSRAGSREGARGLNAVRAARGEFLSGG